MLTPSSGFWSFFGLPSAWLCLKAKATQQQYSHLVMEPWRPHKASSPAQVMRKSFLGIILHTKPPNHCLAVSTAVLCCAVLSRHLAAARAGQLRESIILTVTSTVEVGRRAQGTCSPSQEMLCHSSCNVRDQARQDPPILLLLQQEQELG